MTSTCSSLTEGSTAAMNEHRSCRNCGADIAPHSLEWNGKLFQFPAAVYCAKDECVIAAEAIRAKEEGSKPRPSPTDGCPELFKDTDPNRLPKALADIATSWNPARVRKSLLIHGATRKGKTRCLWYIRNRLKADGMGVKVLTMFELEAEMVGAWGKEKWDQVMKGLIDVDVLGLDDLGKEKMTERMASVLFALIDQRSQNMKPTIITTNHTGMTLAERFHDKELGSALLARLKDRDLFTTVGVAPGNDTLELL